MKILKFILTFFLATMLISCASIFNTTSRFVVEVDAYGNDSYLSNKKYILMSGNSEVNVTDLQFIEFADYIRKALYTKGYVETKNWDEAGLVIFFSYGISDPQTFQETRSVPVWGQTGISSIETTSSTTGSSYGSASGAGNSVYGSAYGSSSGSSTTTTSTKVTPNYGVTGYRQQTSTYTKFFRYLSLDVYDLNVYKSTEEMKMVWMTTLTSDGSSNDLRRVIPHMIAVGSSYFGTNSGEKKSLQIYENDRRVKQLKGFE